MTIYGLKLCFATVEQSAVEHLLKSDRRCTHEAYLSAQPSSEIQGPRFPQENGYRQWPQGSCPPPCKGPQGSVCLSTASWVTTFGAAQRKTGVCAGRMKRSPRSLFRRENYEVFVQSETESHLPATLHHQRQRQFLLRALRTA